MVRWMEDKELGKGPHLHTVLILNSPGQSIHPPLCIPCHAIPDPVIGSSSAQLPGNPDIEDWGTRRTNM